MAGPPKPFPLPMTADNRTRARAPYLEREPAGPLLTSWIERIRREVLDKPIKDDRLPRGAQPPRARGRELPHPHGARHPVARAHARLRTGLVPRFGLARGADPAPPRRGRALCFRLPDTARRRP